MGTDENYGCDCPLQVRRSKDSVWQMGTASCYSDNCADRPGFDLSDSQTIYYPTPLSATGSRYLNLIIGKEFAELVRRVLENGNEY